MGKLYWSQHPTNDPLPIFPITTWAVPMKGPEQPLRSRLTKPLKASPASRFLPPNLRRPGVLFSRDRRIFPLHLRLHYSTLSRIIKEKENSTNKTQKRKILPIPIFPGYFSPSIPRPITWCNVLSVSSLGFLSILYLETLQSYLSSQFGKKVPFSMTALAKQSVPLWKRNKLGNRGAFE